MNKFIAIVFFISCFLLTKQEAHAIENEAGVAARLAIHASPKTQESIDARVVKLEAYLQKHNSPMASSAKTFVEMADIYDLDWRFVASIAGLESTFGKRIPYNSYNPFGWGIPTGAQSGIGFTSWDHAIETVSDGLRNRYINRGLTTIEQIGRVYAASPTWAVRVKFFMNDIEAYDFVDDKLIAMNL